MFDKIDRLKKKPEPYRKKIAFMTSVFITGIIFLIWLSILGMRFNNIENRISKQEEKSMFTEIKESFSGVLNTGKERFDDSKKELENVFQLQQ